MTVQPIDPATAMRVARAALPVRTDRLMLRTLSPDDLDRVREYRNAPQQRRWTYTNNQTDAELLAWTAGGAAVLLKDGDALQLGIEQDGRLVGDLMVRITNFGSRQAELGWMVAPEAQGRGIATEAAQAAVSLCFAVGAHRVVAVLDEDNVASRVVAERLGMTLEGRFVDDEVDPATGRFGTSLHMAVRADA